MGVLYRAHDPLLERDVAIKLMLVDFKTDPTARERFHREARAVARLQHRNVVTIHELGESEGTPYIVMEFLTGRDLEALLKRDPPLGLDEKLDVTIQLCVGLSYAHEQGIVHRDIKPSNVRVLEDGTVKILDFGIAKFALSAMTQSGSVMGTAQYMAPEQIMGQPVDGRADLFSTGVLLYEIIAGQKPFTGDTPTAIVYQILHAEPTPIRSIVPEVPEQLGDVIGRALKKDPDHRYSRASEMAAELQIVRSILAGAGHSVLPGGTIVGGATLGGALRTPSGHLVTPPLSAASDRIAVPRTASASRDDAMLTGAPLSGFDATIRPSADATGGAAQAAADAEARRPKSGLPLGAIAGAVAFIAVLGIVVMTLLRGGDSPAPGATTAEGKTGGGSTSAAAPSGAAAASGASAEGDLPSTFSVVSKPAGAKISLDGRETGRVTPAAIPVSAPFPKRLELALDGYEPFSVSLEETDVKTGGREFALVSRPEPVRVSITGPYAFEVLQGNRVLSNSAARHEVTLAPDQLTIRLRSRPYFLNTSIEVRPRGGQRVQLQAPGLGTLAVFSSVETCVISVDGQEIGFPPVPRQEVAAGNHAVAVKCPNGQSESRNVSVPAGQRTAVTFDPAKG
jgi:serine/threonine-protein kinase